MHQHKSSHISTYQISICCARTVDDALLAQQLLVTTVSFGIFFFFFKPSVSTGQTELKQFQMTGVFTPGNTQEVLHIVRIKSMVIIIGV